MKKRNNDYLISVAYPADLYPEYDTKLAKLVNMKDYGSGMGFGERDLHFSFKTYKKALDAFEKFSKIETLNCVSLTRFN